MHQVPQVGIRLEGIESGSVSFRSIQNRLDQESGLKELKAAKVRRIVIAVDEMNPA